MTIFQGRECCMARMYELKLQYCGGISRKDDKAYLEPLVLKKTGENTAQALFSGHASHNCWTRNNKVELNDNFLAKLNTRLDRDSICACWVFMWMRLGRSASWVTTNKLGTAHWHEYQDGIDTSRSHWASKPLIEQRTGIVKMKFFFDLLKKHGCWWFATN